MIISINKHKGESLKDKMHEYVNERYIWCYLVLEMNIKSSKKISFYNFHVNLWGTWNNFLIRLPTDFFGSTSIEELELWNSSTSTIFFRSISRILRVCKGIFWCVWIINMGRIRITIERLIRNKLRNKGRVTNSV